MSALYGLIGKTLSYSFSPTINNKILKALQIDGDYHLYETNPDGLASLILELKHLKVKGTNVTMPYKVEVMKYLDSVSSKATSIGSVNTIVFDKDNIHGDNTDYDGFKMTMDHADIPIKNKTAVVLGTGGAAKSTIHCLMDFGAKDIIVVSRNPSNVKKITENLKVITYEALTHTPKDIIINCTPCGMDPNIDHSPLTVKQIDGAEAVMDLIYNPLETLLLKRAKSLGIKAVDGMFMLVGQAVKSQEIWNKTTIPMDMVGKIYQEIIEEIKK